MLGAAELLPVACVAREALIRDNRKARLVVRPTLLLMDTLPVPLSVLSGVSLTLESTDEEGTKAEKVRAEAVASTLASTGVLGRHWHIVPFSSPDVAVVWLLALRAGLP